VDADHEWQRSPLTVQFEPLKVLELLPLTILRGKVGRSGGAA